MAAGVLRTAVYAEYFTGHPTKRANTSWESSFRFCCLRLLWRLCSPRKPCLFQIGPKPCLAGCAHGDLSYTLEGKVEAYSSFPEAT